MSVLADIRAREGVRWGFIGCGDVTEVKSGPAFSRVSGSSVSAVMRRDGAKAQDYAQRHGVARWTTDADEVILADDVDAVYIATPPSSHAEYALRAAAVCKPVYIEKPLATNSGDGEAIVAACEAAGVPLFVAYYRRALPRFERVRELLAAGAIGDVTRVHLDLQWAAPPSRETVGWRWDPEIAGDGLLLDLGSHGLDLLDHWFGPIHSVVGHKATRLPWSTVTDEVVATFRFDSGVLGTASWGFAGAYPRDSLTVFGSGGTVSVPVFADVATPPALAGGATTPPGAARGQIEIVGSNGAVESLSIEHPKHVHEPLVTLMVEELLGGKARCPSTGASAQRTQVVLDEILK